MTELVGAAVERQRSGRGDNVNCPLCGSGSRSWCAAPDRHYGLAGEWQVYECVSCHHRFQWPIPTETELAGAYPHSYYAFQLPEVDFEPQGLRHRGVWLRLHHMKRDLGYLSLPVGGNLILALLGRWFRRFPLDFGSPAYRPGGYLLDYGSGAGEKVAFARYTGWKTEGIEMSPAAAQAGRDAGLEIHCGTVEELESRPRRYDHIMSSHCVEHVPDVRRLFAAFAAALKPGGTLAIDVPNGASEAAERYQERYYHLTMPLHVHLFNPRSLRSLAEDAGFNEIRMATYSRLHWHAASRALSWPIRAVGGDGVSFAPRNRLSNAAAIAMALPGFLRSLRHLKGDCLVLTAVKASRVDERPGDVDHEVDGAALGA